MVTNADDGYVSVVATVTGSVLGPGEEVGILLVGDDHTVGEEELDISEVSASVARTEDAIGEVAVISVTRDCVGKTEVGVSVVAPVNVAAGMSEVITSVPVTAAVVEGGSVEVVVVRKVVVVGVGVY
jgi:hypothetical protein